MPPRTISSTVALIGLSALTAAEAGSFPNRSESLRSASRAGLHLMDQALGQGSPDSSYRLADYGVLPIAGLSHICEHYELGPNGELVTYDLFSTPMPPDRLEQAIARSRPPSAPQRPTVTGVVQLRVSDFAEAQLPKPCRRRVSAMPRSLLVASRML